MQVWTVQRHGGRLVGFKHLQASSIFRFLIKIMPWHYTNQSVLIILIYNHSMIRLLTYPRQQIPKVIGPSPPERLYRSIQARGIEIEKLNEKIRLQSAEISNHQKAVRDCEDPLRRSEIKGMIREGQYRTVDWLSEIHGHRQHQSMNLTDLLECLQARVQALISTPEACYTTIQQHWILMFVAGQIFGVEIRARDLYEQPLSGNELETRLQTEQIICVGLSHLTEIFDQADRFFRLKVRTSPCYKMLDLRIKTMFSSQLNQTFTLILSMTRSQAQNREKIGLLRLMANEKARKTLLDTHPRKSTEDELAVLSHLWKQRRFDEFSKTSTEEAVRILNQVRLADLLKREDIEADKFLAEQAAERQEFFQRLLPRLMLLLIQADGLEHQTRRGIECLIFKTIRQEEKDSLRRDYLRLNRYGWKFGPDPTLIDITRILTLLRRKRKGEDFEVFLLEGLIDMEKDMLQFRRMSILNEWIARGGV